MDGLQLKKLRKFKLDLGENLLCNVNNMKYLALGFKNLRCLKTLELNLYNNLLGERGIDNLKYLGEIFIYLDNLEHLSLNLSKNLR